MAVLRGLGYPALWNIDRLYKSRGDKSRSDGGELSGDEAVHAWDDIRDRHLITGLALELEQIQRKLEPFLGGQAINVVQERPDRLLAGLMLEGVRRQIRRRVLVAFWDPCAVFGSRR